MTKKIVPFSEDSAQLLFESKEPFPVDLDLAWKWIGYSQKQRALEVLESTFDSGTDYLTLKSESNSTSTSSPQWEEMTPKERAAYARGEAAKTRKQKIFLTVDCFKMLGMKADTEQGKQIRRYFLDCEKRLKDYLKNGPTKQQIADFLTLREPRLWDRRFTPEFYKQMARITGEIQDKPNRRPLSWAGYTDRWVYKALPVGVRETIRIERDKAGSWDKLHQFLSPEGLALFEKHMGNLATIMLSADSVQGVERALGNLLSNGYQGELFAQNRRDGGFQIQKHLKG